MFILQPNPNPDPTLTPLTPHPTQAPITTLSGCISLRTWDDRLR